MSESFDFSSYQRERYSRHLILPQIGPKGQQALMKAKVLLIGAGGLAAPIIQYLAAAGVGKLGIMDEDLISLSNLQRQVIFKESERGEKKVTKAKSFIRHLNPEVKVKAMDFHLTKENALEIIPDYDIVVDASDNFPTRYLINDACLLCQKPWVYGAIYRFEGQVALFNQANEEGKVVDYRDLSPQPPTPGLVPDCSVGGVLGVLPGIIGSLQANEVIKWITGIGQESPGRLWIFDALTMESRRLKILRRKNRPKVSELIDYEQFCKVNDQEKTKNTVKEVSVKELKELQDQGKDIQLIDVREEYEYEIANLGGELIPLGSILNQSDQVSKDKMVIIHCRSGARSATAVKQLETKLGLDNLYNLKGGILAWSDEIDPSVPKY